MKLNIIDFGLGILAASGLALFIPANILFFGSLVSLAVYSEIKKNFNKP